MNLYDRALIWASVGLIVAIIAGLVVRRRLLSCVAFVAYLCVVAGADALIVLWPERFWRQGFWIFKESLISFLKLAVGLELMVKIFRHFPAAYASARTLVLMVVVGLAALVWYSHSEGAEYLTFVGRLHPHVNVGTVWLLLALGILTLWYHLPLDSVHKAILIGLVPYLLVYTVMQRVWASLGPVSGKVFNLTAPHAYLVVLAYWALIAWRRDPGDAGTRVRRMVSPAEAGHPARSPLP